MRREVISAVEQKVAVLQSTYPGLATILSDLEVRISIPDQFRVSHEAHFAQVPHRFFEYLKSPESMPAWDRANMLAKYYVSTKGVELGRTNAGLPGL